MHKGKLKCAETPFMNGKISQCRELDNSLTNDLVASEEPLETHTEQLAFLAEKRSFDSSLLTHIPLLYVCFVMSSKNYLQSLRIYLIKPENPTTYSFPCRILICF